MGWQHFYHTVELYIWVTRYMNVGGVAAPTMNAVLSVVVVREDTTQIRLGE